MKPTLLALLSLLCWGCSDSETVSVPLGEWVEVSPTDPEVVKALKAINSSPKASLVSARVKAEQNFLHYELVYTNGSDRKRVAKVVKQRWRMVNVREQPDGSRGGTLVPAGDDVDYQLQSTTSLPEPAVAPPTPTQGETGADPGEGEVRES